MPKIIPDSPNQSTEIFPGPVIHHPSEDAAIADYGDDLKQPLTGQAPDEIPIRIDPKSPVKLGNTRKPTFQEWHNALMGREGYKVVSGEIKGPCPACGGTDRFHVRKDGLFGCRQCSGFEGQLRGAGLWHETPLKTPKQPESEWTYLARSGEKVKVIRHEGKRFERRPKGLTGLKWLPLYWPKIASRNPDQIILVEGEKCADHLTGLDYPATCGIGGAGAVGQLDAAVLEGRKIVLWRDNDDPGLKWQKAMIALLTRHGCALSIVQIPEDRESGWDCADATETEIAELIGHAVPAGDPEGSQFEFKGLTEMKPRPVNWLVPGWIPRRALTLVAGQPGEGKTTLALSLAAATTLGGKWGGHKVEKGKVIIYSGEDTFPEIILPNLMAQGADLNQITTPVTGFDDEGQPEEFQPAKHIGQMQDALRDQPDTRLVILDPALAVASRARDEYRANDIRKALQPVQRLAEELDIAVVCVTHFLKAHNSRGSGVLDRVIGSQAWGAVARMVIGIERQELGRVAMRVKSNWGPSEGGFMFDIESREVQTGIYGKSILFGQPVEGTADQVFGGPVVERDAPAKNSAIDWIGQYLTEYPDGQEWDQVCSEGKEDGDYTKKTLRNARDEMKQLGMIECKREKTGNRGGRFLWKLTEK